MKKTVVTGGAGFIGSHLAESLSRHDYQVVIIDNLSTGKMANIENSLDMANVEFVQGSITDLPLLERLFQGATYVFHQAAIPSVSDSMENPIASHEVNATGTVNVLLAARDNKVRKVIYASSCSIYGDMCSCPNREEVIPHPQSPYAVAKLASEHYCQFFHQSYGPPTVCLRYFNVYGPRQDPNSQYAAVIPSFINQVYHGSPPIIFGDGKQTRDFVFVKDVVEANLLAAENGAAGTFNIGRGEEISIKKLAKLIIQLTGNGIKPIQKEPRHGDIKHSLADISQARTFGYEPKWTLEEGLRETIRSFQYEI